jgi:hypothetical protein
MNIRMTKSANSVERSKTRFFIHRALVVQLAAATKANLVPIKCTTSSQLYPHPHLDTSAFLGTYKEVSVSELYLEWYRSSKWWQ